MVLDQQHGDAVLRAACGCGCRADRFPRRSCRPPARRAAAKRASRRARGRIRAAAARRMRDWPANSSRLCARSKNSSVRSISARAPREPPSQRRRKFWLRCSPEFCATQRFCQTVNCPNRRMFWNVRAIPERHARMRRQIGNVGAIEDDAAGGRRKQAADEIDDRALARAVGADEAEDFAARDRQIDAVDRANAAEMLGEALQIKHRFDPCSGRTAASGRAPRRRRAIRAGAHSSPARSARRTAGCANRP